MTKPMLVAVALCLLTACGLPEPLRALKDRRVAPQEADRSMFEPSVLAQKAPASWVAMQRWPEPSLNFLRDAYNSIDFVPGALDALPRCTFSVPLVDPISGIVPTEHVADAFCHDSGQNCLTYQVSPEAANRLLFGTFDDAQDGGLLPSGAERSRLVMARPMVRGKPFDALNAGTLSAWECDDFLTLVRPTTEVFAQHDKMGLLLASMKLAQAYAASAPQALAALVADLLGDY